MTDHLTIGTGAGFAGDRIDPAATLADKADLDYLVFECLAERTIANAQRRKMDDPSTGYTPLLSRRMEAVLPSCVENNTRIITNMGAANPEAARKRVIDIATELGISDLSVASVAGSAVRDRFDHFEEQTFSGESTTQYQENCVSANAYLGVQGILDALNDDADVIITGRVADPSLFLAPMCYEHGWELTNATDVDQIGQGVACAHLLECAGQVTGGYFADPDYKGVPNLETLGFPIAEVTADGDVTITKIPNSGGKVTLRTCKEQILYEVHDPSAYLTPDAIADFSNVSFEQVGTDRVQVSGATADPKPETLKVNIGYEDGVLGEGQISYAGPNAEQRARLAGDTVRKRLVARDFPIDDLRVDIMGVDSLHEGRGRDQSSPYEVRLRVAGKCETAAYAGEIGREVQTLYTNGPAGGGGATMRTKPVLGIVSTLIDRNHVHPDVCIEEVK
jgi:Acyclic terpene utilisation family protein AtuA